MLRVDAITEELQAADLVVLLTDQDAFEYERAELSADRILDGRCRLGTASNVERL